MAAALFAENAKWGFEETHGYTYICVCEFFRFRVLRFFFFFCFFVWWVGFLEGWAILEDFMNWA